MKRTTFVCDACGKWKRDEAPGWFLLSLALDEFGGRTTSSWISFPGSTSSRPSRHACSIECAREIAVSAAFIEDAIEAVQA